MEGFEEPVVILSGFRDEHIVKRGKVKSFKKVSSFPKTSSVCPVFVSSFVLATLGSEITEIVSSIGTIVSFKVQAIGLADGIEYTIVP